MTTQPPGVLGEVVAERERQNDKWGVQNHDNGWWTAILVEEVGEAAQAALQARFGGRYTEDDLRMELVQVAAVAVQWVECIDRRRALDSGDPEAR